MVAKGSPCSIEWIVIPAPNVDVARQFYSTVFGFTFTEHSANFVPFRAGNLAGALDGDREPASAPGGVTFSITVAALGQALDRILAGGGRVTRQAYSLGPGAGYCAGFMDPAGNALELYSQAE